MMYLRIIAPTLFAYVALAQQPTQEQRLPSAVPSEACATLALPVKLQADGSAISTGKYNGHSGPLLSDFDGDGMPDLLVGNYKGYIQVYGNVGIKTQPKFTAQGLLQAQGKDFYVKNW